jgi:putative DNA primase/helicase
MFSAEDDVSDTLVPRLLAAGADLTRVFFIKMTKTENGKRMFDIDADRDQLRQAVDQIGNVIAATFDPFSAYLGRGRVDTYRTNEVRAVLGPLAELAAETNLSIIGVLHFNKKTDVTNAMLRISDSLAFVAASRSAYAVVADDENQRKLLVRAKNNLAPASLDKALAYYCAVESVGKDPDTGETITAPHVIWHPHYIDVTTTEAMQAAADNKSPGQLDDAKTFLAELLDEGPVAEKLAEREDISKRTLRRAKKRLSIETAKERGCDPGRGVWFWRLPGRHKWPWDETKGGQNP